MSLCVHVSVYLGFFLTLATSWCLSVCRLCALPVPGLSLDTPAKYMLVKVNW